MAALPPPPPPPPPPPLGWKLGDEPYAGMQVHEPPPPAAAAVSSAMVKDLTSSLGARVSVLATGLAKPKRADGTGGYAPYVSADDDMHWQIAVVLVDRTSDPPLKWLYTYHEQEYKECVLGIQLHETMAYQAETPLLYTFASATGGEVLALEFASEAEATALAGRLQSLIPLPPPPVVADATETKAKGKPGFLRRLFSRGTLNRKKKQLQHVQIGRPTHFVHKSHLGFDPHVGFDLTQLPADWKHLFKESGITKKDLRNPETANLIYSAAKDVMMAGNGDNNDNARSSRLNHNSGGGGGGGGGGPPPPPPLQAVRVRSATVMPPKSSSSSLGAANGSIDHSMTRARAVSQQPADMMDEIIGARGRLRTVVPEDEDKVMNIKTMDQMKRMSMVTSLKAIMAHRRAIVSDDGAIDEDEEDESDESDVEW